jgi:hypothetical protein
LQTSTFTHKGMALRGATWAHLQNNEQHQILVCGLTIA